jgi:hypothetical protein
MKRMLLLAPGLVLIFASVAFAQEAQSPPTATAPQVQGTPSCPQFIDADGDGICDSRPARAGQKRGRGNGPGDGTGNQGVGPKDGTGYGAVGGNRRGPGTGNCTGPCQPGRGGRRGRR